MISFKDLSHLEGQRLFFIEVQFIYNVVLITIIQQNDSVIFIYVFCLIFLSIMVHHRILNTALCAIQLDLV